MAIWQDFISFLETETGSEIRNALADTKLPITSLIVWLSQFGSIILFEPPVNRYKGSEYNLKIKWSNLANLAHLLVSASLVVEVHCKVL